jgi:hypothetical protein
MTAASMCGTVIGSPCNAMPTTNVPSAPMPLQIA